MTLPKLISGVLDETFQLLKKAGLRNDGKLYLNEFDKILDSFFKNLLNEKRNVNTPFWQNVTRNNSSLCVSEYRPFQPWIKRNDFWIIFNKGHFTPVIGEGDTLYIVDTYDGNHEFTTNFNPKFKMKKYISFPKQEGNECFVHCLLCAILYYKYEINPYNLFINKNCLEINNTDDLQKPLMAEYLTFGNENYCKELRKSEFLIYSKLININIQPCQ